MTAKPKTKAKTIDEYLATVSDDKRAALEKLRKTIRAAAPMAEEYINYGIAAFRLDGKLLVGFGAGANHCSFFPGDGSTVAAFEDELKGFDTSKGTIRFQADKPLPVALVRKIIKARLTELADQGPAEAPRVAIAKRAARPESGLSRTNPAVIAYLRELEHPLTPVLEAVRKIILGVDPAIREGIKWNAPSFHFKEYFATAGLRPKEDFVRLVLHKGAKVKGNTTQGMRIADPGGMLEWHDKERCSAKFHDVKEVKSKSAALADIVRQWIKQM